jgi:hypothetical protein
VIHLQGGCSAAPWSVQQHRWQQQQQRHRVSQPGMPCCSSRARLNARMHPRCRKPVHTCQQLSGRRAAPKCLHAHAVQLHRTCSPAGPAGPPPQASFAPPPPCRPRAAPCGACTAAGG